MKDMNAMKDMKVFKYGRFYTYDSNYLDPSWDDTDIFIATSMFATLKYKEYDTNTAYSLSSMYMYQKTMPGIHYTSLGNNIIPHNTKKNTIV